MYKDQKTKMDRIGKKLVVHSVQSAFSKWADKDCEYCKGTGEYQLNEDEITVCICARENKAEHDADYDYSENN